MNTLSKIFVAGATGMVGSAIIRQLVENGFKNIVGSYNQRQINTQPSVVYKKVNLLNISEVESFFATEKPEYVFLAAAKVGGIIANNTYRGQFIYENLQIQNNIIHQSYLNNVKKLMFLGSSCIYPKQCPQPMKEDYLLTNTLEYTNEPYAIAKIAGLKMCESYNLQYGTNYISVMPTNLYGQNDNFDLEKSHVLPALIRKMHLGKCLANNDMDSIRKDLAKNPIESINSQSSDTEILAILKKYGLDKNEVTLWGTGSPRREFLHANDLAAACVFLMQNVDFKDIAKDATNVINTHINVGTGKDLTIKELAEMIQKIVGYQGQLIWDSTKPDGTFQKLLDVSKLNGLGWKEQILMQEGIETVYQEYK